MDTMGIMSAALGWDCSECHTGAGTDTVKWEADTDKKRAARRMTLMMADRVDMVEGVVADFARGRPPNLAREMGWRTEWRYNRKRVITGAAVTAVSLAAIYLLMRSRRRR